MAYHTLSRTGFPGPIGVTEQTKLASECTAETWSLVSHASSLLTSPTSHRPTVPPSHVLNPKVPNTHRTQHLRTMALDTSVTRSSRLQCEAVSFIQPIPMPVRLKISTDAIERPKVIPFNSVGGLVQPGQGFPLAGTHASRQHWSPSAPMA
jgi:hypothetical protein